MKSERVYSVYVIELSDESGRRKNPRFPCVYVGQTSKTPEERFVQHKEGGTFASLTVFRHGVRLLPELYERRNPVDPSEKPEKAELRLAKYLDAQGYTVKGGGLRAARARQAKRRKRLRPPGGTV